MWGLWSTDKESLMKDVKSQGATLGRDWLGSCSGSLIHSALFYAFFCFVDWFSTQGFSV